MNRRGHDRESRTKRLKIRNARNGDGEEDDFGNTRHVVGAVLRIAHVCSRGFSATFLALSSTLLNLNAYVEKYIRVLDALLY